MGWSRGIIAFILIVAVTLTTGCGAPSSRQPTAGQAPTPSLVWPPPPSQPRIRFVRAVARPQDLGITPSFWKRLGEIFVGRAEDWFIRPTGVAAKGQMIYVADAGGQALWILDPQVGRFQRIGEAGTDTLISPVAVAPGRNDQVYLADSFLRKIFIFDAGGKVVGAVADPNLKRPAGLAYDAASDRLYVADSLAHRVWIFAGNGEPVGGFGHRGMGSGEFNFPTHVAVGREGVLWVTDSLGFRVQSFTSDGTFIGQFGKHGDTSGDFAMPKGIAVDSTGRIYVVDALFDAVQIFDSQGQLLLSFGERGIGPGQFWLPGGLFIDPQDRVYVADAYNQRIQIFERLPVAPDE